MPAADPFRALLEAEVALALGVAPAEAIGDALRASWLAGPDEGAALLDILQQSVSIEEGLRREVEAEVASRLDAAGGDVRQLADVGPLVTRVLTRGKDLDAAPLLRPAAEGRYTDFFPVGRGGMGIVYWALDTELSRQIAFKVIAPTGGDGEDGATPAAPLELGTPDPASPAASSFDGARWRFLQEAWVTGGMDHPGIVPVYELGETTGGVPYYTMRFVRGNRSLKDAIEEEEGADVGTRLERLLEPFLKVCDTVRYAHARGVIHRDLKPENVALGEYGEVVVLDWGLARVRGPLDVLEDPWADRVQGLREEGALHTVASALGTPGYLSPEAARGETDALDERSDVYALGAMLFQILTGRLPFRFQTTEEYLGQVLADEAPNPVDVASGVPARLAALCRQALARDPTARPASADAFAEAIRNWRTDAAREREVDVLLGQAEAALTGAADLTGEDLLRELDRAVVAGRRVLELETDQPQARQLVERAGAMRERGIQERERQARRRTLQRAGALALGVGVVAAVVVAALLDQRRREASDARARAEEVMNFMVFELQESLEPIGRLDVLARIGTTAREYYATLPSEGLSRESLVGHTVTLRRLGDVSEARGDLPAAIEAYRLAGTVAEQILERDPEYAIGHYHHSLAESREARALFRQGYASDSKRMVLAHREDVLRILEEHPDDAEYRGALADAHAAVGWAHLAAREWDESKRAFGLALEVACTLEAAHAGEEEWTRRRLAIDLDLANLERHVGSSQDALARFEEVLAACLREQEERGLGTDVRWMSLEAECRYRLAKTALHAGRLADEAWAAAYAVADQLREMDPENAARRAHVVLLQLSRSEAAELRGELDVAVRYASEAFEHCEALTKRDPTNATWQNTFLSTCDRLASLGAQLGLGPEHDRHYRRLAAEHAAELVKLDPEYFQWKHLHAYALGQLGRAIADEDPAEAERLLRRSLDITTRLVRLEPDSYELVVLLAFAHEQLGQIHDAAGRHAEAIAGGRSAVADLGRFWVEHSDRYEVIGHLLAARIRLARVLAAGDADERAEARAVLEEGIELAERTIAGEGDAKTLIRKTAEVHLRGLRGVLAGLGADDESR